MTKNLYKDKISTLNERVLIFVISSLNVHIIIIIENYTVDSSKGEEQKKEKGRRPEMGQSSVPEEK